MDEVPKLPRGRGLTLSRPQLVRIVGLVLLLVFLLVMQQPCASGVSTFVHSFGDQGSAATVMPRPDNLERPSGSSGASGASGSGGYEHLRPGMTDEEVKAAIERARVKAAGSGAAP